MWHLLREEQMLERWNRGKKDAILGWEDGGGVANAGIRQRTGARKAECEPLSFQAK